MTTFSESIYKLLKDKNIEVYSGDSGHERNYADSTVICKSIIRGTLVGCEVNCLILKVLGGVAKMKWFI